MSSVAFGILWALLLERHGTKVFTVLLMSRNWNVSVAHLLIGGWQEPVDAWWFGRSVHEVQNWDGSFLFGKDVFLFFKHAFTCTTLAQVGWDLRRMMLVLRLCALDPYAVWSVPLWLNCLLRINYTWNLITFQFTPRSSLWLLIICIYWLIL